MRSARFTIWKTDRAVDRATPPLDPWAREDAVAFTELIERERASGGLLAADVPAVLARAPGRLDVMGGIADYSGSLVLQWPIAEATFAAVQRAGDEVIRIESRGAGPEARVRRAEIGCSELMDLSRLGYDAVGERFSGERDRWAAYVVGALAVLVAERDLESRNGMRVLLSSRVPEGKGVSSSAALEVAAMQAMAEVSGVRVRGEELAALCQIAENRVVGAACGIMDQMTAAIGRQDKLLSLLCQPAEVVGFLEIPSAIRLWGIDSGIRHAVSGSDYTSVRTGAFMGYRILADARGLAVTGPDSSGRMAIEDPSWRGYLANVGVGDLESRFGGVLPESLSGGEFLARYGGTTDTVTRVDPSHDYAVRVSTEHPIREHARVVRFANLLSEPIDDDSLEEMGSLMYASHASYSACGLGSEGTDRLVELVREAGPRSGLFGAKITGGGSGGTVAVLGRAEAAAALEAIARRYARETEYAPMVFSGSSPGAMESGTRSLNGSVDQGRND